MAQRWTDELVKKLLQAVHIDYFKEFVENDNNSHKISKLYAKIADEIDPQKNFSGEDIRNKYNKLKSTYNKHKDAFNTSGWDGSAWKWWNAFHETIPGREFLDSIKHSQTIGLPESELTPSEPKLTTDITEEAEEGDYNSLTESIVREAPTKKRRSSMQYMEFKMNKISSDDTKISELKEEMNDMKSKIDLTLEIMQKKP